MARMNLKEKHKKVLDCYLKGMGVVEIAKSLGIAYATVWRHRVLLQKKYIEVTGYQVHLKIIFPYSIRTIYKLTHNIDER